MNSSEIKTMIELPLFDKDGKNVGTVNIDETVFGDKVKKKLLHDVITSYEGNKRQGNADTKTRGEVEGSTRKPWKQKHTGRARVGTIRSPIWRHGGVIFGPHPRDYRRDIPKKMKVAALNSAILGKLKDKEVLVIEKFDFDKPSTKRMSAILKNIGIRRSCLIGTDKYSKNAWLSTRNIPQMDMATIGEFNPYDVIKNKNVLLTKGALDILITARRGKAAEKLEVAST